MSWHHRDCWSEHGRCAACGREADIDGAAEPVGSCPRCAVPLQQVRYADITVHLCGTCWSSWVPIESLGPLLIGFDTAYAAEPEPSGPRVDPQVHCVACGKVATKWAWRGLVLDACAGHGVFLDSWGELIQLKRLSIAHPDELHDLLTGISAL